MSDEKYLFQEDELIFAEDEGEEVLDKYWKIMVIDDEKDIHQVTQMVLKDVSFDGKGIDFINAYSAQSAKEILSKNDDIAVILLDVVMEKDTSGLDLVKYIRDDLKNPFVRIILRTGYPGEAPERDVILNYDINDYKEKTELTSQKLFTSVISALRAYKDIVAINRNNEGLEKIIESSGDIFELRSIRHLSEGLLKSMLDLIVDVGSKKGVSGLSLIVDEKVRKVNITAGYGRFCDKCYDNIDDIGEEVVKLRLEKSMNQRKTQYGDDYYVGYFKSHVEKESLIYLDGFGKLETWQKHLLGVFDKNVGIAFDNIFLNREIEKTQSELIFTLGEVVEVRSEETGNHVRRVAEYAKLLALKVGFSEEEAERLRVASPMHDLGKVGIPDAILHKPSKLTEEEFEIMKRHTTIGYEMLKNSKRKLLKLAAIVALEHHEHFDGRGYPMGLKGEDIHISGRIMAICDVFDALTSDRVYRKAWDTERVLDYIRERVGTQFDPKIAAIFFEEIDEILKIKEMYSD
ncbi:MAG: DUF3369 domain-containing protein [Tissierellales bacterium]|nr:DUF3369 domain-containing protein [Tissierellales bacterium]